MKQQQEKQGVNLILGDCLEKMKDIPDGSVDLTVTSPPYDNLRTYNGNNEQWNEDVWKAVIKDLFRVTKDGGVVVWVVGESKPPFLDDTDTAKMIIELDENNKKVRPELYSAFLSSELGEMLKPYSFYSNNICSDFPVWLPEKQKWGFMDDKPEWVYGDTEANTRALWLIYLIENGLLSPKQEGGKE